MTTVNAATAEPATSGAPADLIAPLHAAKTRQLYTADWAAFSMWCRRHETEALPAAPGQVLAYLATLGGTGQPDGAWFKAGLHMELGEAGLTLPGWTMAP